METKAMLNITTTQEESGEQIELTTLAQCSKIAQGVQLSFQENLTGEDSTSSVLTILEDCVILTREGEYSSNMLFETNKTHQCAYNVGESEIDMRIFTTYLKTNFNENNINANVSYHLSLDGMSIGNINMSISARAV